MRERKKGERARERERYEREGERIKRENFDVMKIERNKKSVPS